VSETKISRKNERMLILMSKEDIERIDAYVAHKTGKQEQGSLGRRGQVLRDMILLTVGRWEKRERENS
jgi:hypothetical protein